jgi:hypothetical protein
MTGDPEAVRSMSKLLNVRAGMLASVAAIALAVGGLVTAVAVIVADGAGFAFLAEDFVPQIAAIGIGFGLLARVVLPRDPDNLVLWVYALVAVLSGVFVAATAISYAGARLQGIPLTNEAIGILRPVDVGFTTAFSVMVGAIVISPAIFWLLSLGILLFPTGGCPQRGGAGSYGSRCSGGSRRVRSSATSNGPRRRSPTTRSRAPTRTTR